MGARAEGRGAVPVRIAYHADGASCATAAAFRDAVRRRAPELEDAAGGVAAREFIATVEQRADGIFYGTLEISESSGARVRRLLDGDDCREVTEALAFIVAELGRAATLDEAAPAVPRSESPFAPARVRSEAAKRERPSLFEGGVGLQALHGAAPDLLFAPVVYGELRALHDGGSLVSSGRLSLLYAKSGTMHGTIGDAQIRWLAGRAEICGPRLDVPASSLGACALVDAGSLEGRGSRSVAPKTRRAFWLAPGLLGRFRLVLERTLVVGIEGSVFFPLVRPTFYFAGSEAAEREVVHEVEAVGASAGLGLGVLIP